MLAGTGEGLRALGAWDSVRLNRTSTMMREALLMAGFPEQIAPTSRNVEDRFPWLVIGYSVAVVGLWALVFWGALIA